MIELFHRVVAVVFCAGVLVVLAMAWLTLCSLSPVLGSAAVALLVIGWLDSRGTKVQ